ncbi:MAG: DMT family transporter [Pseudotabrizicola sp.]|uniref:DMT family transporter n=1 Tax=Pseudotabrizicola sp. TaxID=2939647 RepID=UPI00271C5C33|nr:DMT family transporter [Pseudotabrizicola sp.]MDO8883859.1 DMT family transporter [Pseudotabrizicola sp.]MDP2080637.1 DMT family transporter [Pseudotabrizicola sp.]MDZ7573366.1 DMT family transporter [Pseudotabrizicola sp.]
MSNHRLFALVLVALGVGWGLTQPLGKLATSTGYQPFGLIFWQLVICTLVLGTMSLARGKGLLFTRPALIFALVVAVLGTLVPNATFYTSVQHLPSGIMSILISAVPMLSFPIALALGMDRFSIARVAGLMLGLIGVAMIAAPGAGLPGHLLAFIPLALIGPLFYAMEANYVARSGTGGMDAVQAMFMASLVGMILCLPVTLATGQWIDPRGAWGVAEWGLVGSSVAHALCYAGYVWLASRAGAVFAAQCSYLVTGAGVIWAMLLLGERLQPLVWVALVVMLSGVALVQPRAVARADQGE